MDTDVVFGYWTAYRIRVTVVRILDVVRTDIGYSTDIGSFLRISDRVFLVYWIFWLRCFQQYKDAAEMSGCQGFG